MKRTVAIVLGLLLTLGIFFQTEAQFPPTDARALGTRVPLLVAGDPAVVPLVEQVGVAEVIGRPKTFGTTAAFLEYFGLKNLEELPAADELRRIPINKPDSLLTVDPGLATAPPDQLAGSPAEVVATGPVEAPSPAEPPR